MNKEDRRYIVQVLQLFEKEISNGKSVRYMDELQKSKYKAIVEAYRILGWNELTDTFDYE